MIRIMSDWRTVELKIVPRILRAKSGRTYERYTIKGHYEGGKRCQRIFRSRKEAENLLQLLQRERRHHGLSATEMPMRLRVEAHQCLQRLEKHGASLTQATDWYLAHLEKENRLQKCQNMAFYLAEFVRLKENRVKSGELADETLKNIRGRVRTIKNALGDLPILSVTRGRILSFLEQLALSPQTRSHYRGLLSEFFNYALQKDWVGVNPMAALGRLRGLGRRKDRDVGILTVAEAWELLEQARQDPKADLLVPYLTLGLFAGLRPYEALKIRWEAIDFGLGNIEVNREITKTRKTRHVEMNEIARAWLQPYRKAEGLVTGDSLIGYRKAFERIRRRCGWAVGKIKGSQAETERLPKPWTPDVLRHSFASYWLAVHQNRPKLAEQMGNSPEVIANHYRKPIPSKEAEGYWTLRPTAIAQKILADT
jgi:integrase